jgi:polyisoprenoid-binding protein YceI
MVQMPSEQGTAQKLRTQLEDGTLAGEWVLDAGESSIRLKSKSMWGLASVNGGFREVSGNGTVSADGKVSGTVTVAAASIDTKNSKRDTHLRSADFFDSANSPDITFTVDSVVPSDQGAVVSGALRVRDQTGPLSFNAAASVPDSGKVQFDAEIAVNRSDFGLTWNGMMGMASMHSTLIVSAVFTRR